MSVADTHNAFFHWKTKTIGVHNAFYSGDHMMYTAIVIGLHT